MEKGYYDDTQQVTLHAGFDDPSLAFGADYQRDRSEMSVEVKWQDVHFGIAFLVHLLITAIIFVVTISRSDLPVYDGIIPSTTKAFVPLILKAFAASAFVAVILAYLALVIMRSFPTFCIHAAMIMNLVVLTVGVVVVMVKVAWWLGLVLLIMPLLWAFIYWSMIPLIPFLSELLSAVSGLVMRYPSTIGLNIVSVVAQFGWIMIFSYVILLMQSKYGRNSVIGMTVYLLLSFFWTLQMLKNIVHTTNCGVFATWYFMNGTSSMPSSPMPASLKRTMTTSFGSVAFGSLVVAIIQTLKAIATIGRNSAMEDASSNGDGCSVVLCIIASMARCLLGCLEAIALYINHYAFVIVATYGQSYLQAGKSTLIMFQRTGFINLLNDNMLDRLHFAIASLIATLIAFASVGFTLAIGLSNNYIGIICACSFVSAFLIAGLVMQTVESAAATIYVCFAEDSAVLARTNPELYSRIRNTFGGDIVTSPEVV
jgi:hypothetical protein